MIRRICEWLLIKVFHKKEEAVMVMIYVALIIKGKKTFAQVPEVLKERVREMLIDLDLGDLAEE